MRDTKSLQSAIAALSQFGITVGEAKRVLQELGRATSSLDKEKEAEGTEKKEEKRMSNKRKVRIGRKRISDRDTVIATLLKQQKHYQDDVDDAYLDGHTEGYKEGYEEGYKDGLVDRVGTAARNHTQPPLGSYSAADEDRLKYLVQYAYEFDLGRDIISRTYSLRIQVNITRTGTNAQRLGFTITIPEDLRSRQSSLDLLSIILQRSRHMTAYVDVPSFVYSLSNFLTSTGCCGNYDYRNGDMSGYLAILGYEFGDEDNAA